VHNPHSEIKRGRSPYNIGVEENWQFSSFEKGKEGVFRMEKEKEGVNNPIILKKPVTRVIPHYSLRRERKQKEIPPPVIKGREKREVNCIL